MELLDKEIVLESGWEIHTSKISMIFSLLSLWGYMYILNKDEGGRLENTISLKLKGIPKAMGCCVSYTLQKSTSNDQ